MPGSFHEAKLQSDRVLSDAHDKYIEKVLPKPTLRQGTTGYLLHRLRSDSLAKYFVPTLAGAQV
ncbi:hypothetical protein C1N53_22215 (plasmid) [Pontibacter sp. SGAir0037]|nr:hypothetical protein C1N53_22215 [Pontibacter sp. SGAir0037]